MATFNYSKNNIDVVINIGDSNHRFSHVKNGVTIEHQIKSFRSDYKAKSVVVEYAIAYKDSEGNVIKTEAKSYTESTPARYSGLYSLNGFYEAAGDFYGKQCCNGVAEREIGFKFFNNNGTLIEETQP